MIFLFGRKVVDMGRKRKVEKPLPLPLILRREMINSVEEWWKAVA